MIGNSWFGLLSGLVLAFLVAAVARLAFRGGALRRTTFCAFGCPEGRGPVNCRILQDIRTGQWMAVQSCSALLEAPGAATCVEECRERANLGLLVPQTQAPR